MIDLPEPALIGVVHVPALPGSPAHQGSMPELLDRCVGDARTYENAGFDAVVVENYGDLPFGPGALSPASLAGLAVVTGAVAGALRIPVGVNALRNDAMGALGIAAVTGAAFVRVNVHTGVYATDQGLIEGRAEQSLRYRQQLGKRIAILADVHVKHATPISEPDLVQAARACAYRGLADGLIVTGPATGEPVDLDQLRQVCAAVPDRRVFVGSGAAVETVQTLLRIAGGVIVGTGVKQNGRTEARVDPHRAEQFVRSARGG